MDSEVIAIDMIRMHKGIHIQYVNDNEEDGEFPKPIGTSQVLEQYLEASAKTTMDSLHAKLERFAWKAQARQIILPERAMLHTNPSNAC